MLLSIDLATLEVTPAVVAVRRGDRFRVEVRFVSGGVASELTSGAVGRLVVKKTGDFSGAVVAGSRPMGPPATPPPPHRRKVGYAANAYYVFDLDLNTQQMDELFVTLAGEVALVELILEIEWGYRGMRRTSKAVKFTVENDYARTNDEPPTVIAT
jgi:hypothetical protein